VNPPPDLTARFAAATHLTLLTSPIKDGADAIQANSENNLASSPKTQGTPAMPDRKKALIAGATGVVGRNLQRHLLTLDDWDVIAVSRRKPDVEGQYEHIAVDLLDREQTLEALKRPRGVTHVFFSAYIERPTWAEMVAPNQTMLVNLMDAIETASPDLAHVNLMHGTKWYGNHLGPFKTPAKEDDPRHMPPNFYYDQQDLVAARQRGKTWTWSTARPHAICGFATGNPMNLVMVLAVYGAHGRTTTLSINARTRLCSRELWSGWRPIAAAPMSRSISPTAISSDGKISGRR
jgi:progesterone 5beta-reductase/iridoid synthase-like 1,4-enone reductase family protein